MSGDLTPSLSAKCSVTAAGLPGGASVACAFAHLTSKALPEEALAEHCAAVRSAATFAVNIAAGSASLAS